MDDTYPSNSVSDNYLISPSSSESPPVKRQIIDRHAEGFKFVPRNTGSPGKPTGNSGKKTGDKVKIPADWSKDSTFALIRAWGDRFLLNGKGKLNSDHWAQIARDVNANCERRFQYSVLQCQNRVETLKKMYKKHKSGLIDPNSSNSSNNWGYFEKMDELMGEREHQIEREIPKIKIGHEITREDLNGEIPANKSEEEEDDTGDLRLRVLGDAIKGIEEVFERVERLRREKVKELEKMRIEFLKDLEMKQREIFENAQNEIAMIGNNSDNDNNNINNDNDNDNANDNDNDDYDDDNDNNDDDNDDINGDDDMEEEDEEE